MKSIGTALLLAFIFQAAAVIAQPADSSIMLPNRLVVSSVKNANVHIQLDSTGILSVVCVNKSDSLIRMQYRQLAGKLISFTDSSLVLHVDREEISTYRRNGSMEQFYYWKSEDSLQMHIDTLRFSEVYSLRFDTGRFRPVIGIMQSTAYTFMLGNLAVLVAALIIPKKYGSIVPGTHLLLATSISTVTGSGSFLFYPKVFRVNQQYKKKHRVKWKLEVR